MPILSAIKTTKTIVLVAIAVISILLSTFAQMQVSFAKGDVGEAILTLGKTLILTDKQIYDQTQELKKLSVEPPQEGVWAKIKMFFKWILIRLPLIGSLYIMYFMLKVGKWLLDLTQWGSPLVHYIITIAILGLIEMYVIVFMDIQSIVATKQVPATYSIKLSFFGLRELFSNITLFVPDFILKVI